MYYVYVLKSLKNGKRYIGFTSQSVNVRVKQHHSGTNQWTRQNSPFAIIHIEEFSDRRSAQVRERWLKSGHGRSFLDKFIPR